MAKWQALVGPAALSPGQVQQTSQRGIQRTCKLVLGGDLNHDLVVSVLQAIALHVGAVVVPHLSQLELGGDLHGQVGGGQRRFGDGGRMQGFGRCGRASRDRAPGRACSTTDVSPAGR